MKKPRRMRSRKKLFQFRLYVSGASERSSRAIQNLRGIFDRVIPDSYQVEVIDIYQQPERAVQEQILAVPTLVRFMPTPVRRLVGDFSDSQWVAEKLGLPA